MDAKKKAAAAAEQKPAPKARTPKKAISAEDAAATKILAMKKAAKRKGEVVIRFTAAKVVEDEHQGTADETRHAEGDFLACVPATAEHFVTRGVAERV